MKIELKRRRENTVFNLHLDSIEIKKLCNPDKKFWVTKTETYAIQESDMTTHFGQKP